MTSFFFMVNSSKWFKSLRVETWALSSRFPPKDLIYDCTSCQFEVYVSLALLIMSLNPPSFCSWRGEPYGDLETRCLPKVYYAFERWNLDFFGLDVFTNFFFNIYSDKIHIVSSVCLGWRRYNLRRISLWSHRDALGISNWQETYYYGLADLKKGSKFLEIEFYRI